MHHFSKYLLFSLTIVLLLLTSCQGNRPRAYLVVEPLMGLPNPELVGPETKLSFPTNTGSFSGDHLTYVQVAPASEVKLSDFSYTLLTDDSLFEKDQAYLYLRNKRKHSPLLELKYYFPNDFEPPTYQKGSHSKATADRLVMRGKVRDSTGQVLYEFSTSNPLEQDNHAYSGELYEAFDHVTFRDFSPGEQELTVDISGHLSGMWGYQGPELFNFEFSYVDSLPELVVTRFHYQDLKLTQDAYNRDWDAFLANDAPDIYWELSLAGEEVWNSHVDRNSRTHTRSEVIEIFHYYEEEPLQIDIFDDDILLNGDDYIDGWRGYIMDLESETMLTLTMPDVEYFHIRAEHLGKYEPRKK